MAELDFGDTDGQRMIVMQGAIQRMYTDFYGNGRPGFRDEFQRFASEFKGAEEERSKQHKSNLARLNLIIALLGMIAAYIAVIVTVRPWHSVGAFHSTLPSTYTAER